MLVYSVLLLFLTLVFFFSLKKRKPIFLYITSLLILFGIAWLRDASVGTDTQTYLLQFENLELYDTTRYFTGIQRGWYYFNLLFSSYFNYDVFLFACYSIIIGGIGYWIYKESDNYIMSLFFFVLFMFYFGSFNIMRQYIAISIVFMALLHFKNIKIYVSLVLLASLFHFSALFAYSFLLINKVKIGNIIFVLCTIIISFIVGFFYGDKLTDTINTLMWLARINEGVQGYLDAYGGGRNILPNLGINSVFILSYILSKTKKNLYLKLYFFYIILFNLFGSMGQGNRIFLYLQIPIIIIIPWIYYRIKNRIIANAYLGYTLMYAAATAYISFSRNTADIIPYIMR